MNKGIVLSLCDYTGKMVDPWLAGGYDAIIVDPQHVGTTSETTVHGTTLTRIASIIDDEQCWNHVRTNIDRIVFMVGFPPCTDLAVSGSRWFEDKYKEDEAFQFKAMQVVWQCYDIARLIGCPFIIENPVSRISTLWRQPDFNFHPYHYVALRTDDNYTKLTCLWSGNGYVHPEPDMLPEVIDAIALVESTCGRMVAKRDALKALPESQLVKDWYPDNRIHDCPPGDDRANFRSATPGGFAVAVFNANAHLLRSNEKAKDEGNNRTPRPRVNLPVRSASNNRSDAYPAVHLKHGVDRSRPFLKWAGGKYAVLDAIGAHMPTGKRLIEPFVGAGSVFLNFQFDEYLLADTNIDLINLYRQMQMFPETVIDVAQKMVAQCQDKESYLKIRKEFNTRQSPAGRHAALFLALNRTCFNGLARYNLDGGFNVGWNKKPESKFPLAELIFWTGKSSKHDFRCAHFSETIAQAVEGDVIFCDPPYEPLPDTAGFVNYNKEGFTFEDQTLLADSLLEAHQRGARVVITNSRAPAIIDLYMTRGFSLNRLEARRNISCDAAKRGNVFDIIATL